MAGVRKKLNDSEIKSLIDAGKSPRYLELEAYQAYFEGNQYAGRVSFLDQTSDVPLLERAPCVVDGVVANAIESNVALAMGGPRFPRLLSQSKEDDSTFDQRFGLSQPDSETLDRFNAGLVEQCGLQTVFMTATKFAEASRSVALVFSYAAGLPTADVLWAKTCEPEFDPKDPTKVVKLTVRYRFVDTVRDASTQWEWWSVVKEYLRVIDTKTDTVFEPVEIFDVRDQGNLGNGKKTAVPHGFGVCPVVWYAHMRPTRAYGQKDGICIHENRTAQIDAINQSLSARHSAALYAGSPQMVATGVDSDQDDFGGGGRVARPMRLPGEAQGEWSKALYDHSGASQGGAIRKGANVLWRIGSETGDVKLLTLPGDALKALDDNSRDLRSRMRESIKYIYIDPETLSGSGDVSGKTLAFVYSNQLNFVNQLRDDVWRGLIKPSLSLLYQMLLAKSDGVYLPGIGKALPILKRFVQTLADGSSAFFFPQIKPKWGGYFEPSDIDEATRVGTAIAAATGKIITTATAVEHIREVFAIENVDQYVDSLATENAQKAADAIARMQATGGDAADPGKVLGAKPPAKQPTALSAAPNTLKAAPKAIAKTAKKG